MSTALERGFGTYLFTFRSLQQLTKYCDLYMKISLALVWTGQECQAIFHWHAYSPWHRLFFMGGKWYTYAKLKRFAVELLSDIIHSNTEKEDWEHKFDFVTANFDATVVQMWWSPEGATLLELTLFPFWVFFFKKETKWTQLWSEVLRSLSHPSPGSGVHKTLH